MLQPDAGLVKTIWTGFGAKVGRPGAGERNCVLEDGVQRSAHGREGAMRLRYLLPAIFLIVPACSTTPSATPAKQPASDINWQGQSILPKGEGIAVLNDRANNPANSQADRARAVFGCPLTLSPLRNVKASSS